MPTKFFMIKFKPSLTFLHLYSEETRIIYLKSQIMNHKWSVTKVQSTRFCLSEAQRSTLFAEQPCCVCQQQWAENIRMDVCRQLDWSKPSERGISLISIISEECNGGFRDDLGGGHMSFLNCFAVKNKTISAKISATVCFFLSGDVWGLDSGSLLVHACSWHANVGSQIHLTGHLLSVKWIYGCGEKYSSSSQREVE